MGNSRAKALGYIRTSSATNFGNDRDDEDRQRTAIERYADRANLEILQIFADPVLKVDDPINARPGFHKLLERIVSDGARVVIVEDASRFARHLLTQKASITLLVSLGVRVLTAQGDDLTDSEDEFRVTIQHVMGLFSQLEKTLLVKKFAADRRRKKRLNTGYAGGPRPHWMRCPEAVAMANELRKKQMSLRSISAELAKAGHLNHHGRPYNSKSVRVMLLRKAPKGADESDLARLVRGLWRKGLSFREIAKKMKDEGHKRSIGEHLHASTVRLLVLGPQKRVKRKRFVKKAESGRTP